MSVQHSPLPFPMDALEPHMSARTLEYHHGKHHKAYVDKTNDAIQGTDLEGKDLEAIIRAAKQQGNQGLFNNSAQVWNHAFFWDSLSPVATSVKGKLAELIDRDFGGLDAFKDVFRGEALGHFGSGWAWLVHEAGKLKVTSYHDADCPLVYEGVTPLLTLDVWEHAYYLDYQNARPRFVDIFLEQLANWEKAEERLQAAL